MPSGVSALTSLANITLSGSALSVTFSSISQSYTDLILIANVNKAGSSYFQIQVNGDTGTNYTSTTMNGNGSTSSGQNQIGNSAFYVNNDNYYGTGWSMFRMDFINYSSSDRHRVFQGRNNAPDAVASMSSNRYHQMTAITSIKIYLSGGWSMSAGTTFALYGVSA